MPLTRAVTDGNNPWQLFPIMSDAKGGKPVGDISGIAQSNQLWELRIERPKLKPDPLLREMSPKLILDRHQTSLTCFFLQPCPIIDMVCVIKIFLPGNREVNGVSCLVPFVKDWAGKVSQELSFRLELGACQAQRTRAMAWLQHRLYFFAQHAP
jgi:hypothetical protein